MLFCVDAEVDLDARDLAELEAAASRRARDARLLDEATLTVTVAAHSGREAVEAARDLLVQILGGRAGAVRRLRPRS